MGEESEYGIVIIPNFTKIGQLVQKLLVVMDALNIYAEVHSDDDP
jgi:hypothetical protein